MRDHISIKLKRLLGCLIVGILVWTAMASAGKASNFSDRLHPPQRIPSFVYIDGEGKEHSLSEYKGRFLLLNIWATWCGPCVHEMPSLEALQAQFPVQQLVVLPVSEDRGDSVVTAFYQSHTLDHLPIAIDRAGMAPVAFDVKALPTTLLINRDGMEVARFVGGMDWAQPRAVEFLKTQLANVANASARP